MYSFAAIRCETLLSCAAIANYYMIVLLSALLEYDELSIKILLFGPL